MLARALSPASPIWRIPCSRGGRHGPLLCQRGATLLVSFSSPSPIATSTSTSAAAPANRQLFRPTQVLHALQVVANEPGVAFPQMVQSRIWNETENWCSLCKEPFNSWNEHRGKRDHICLTMFFEQIVKSYRPWDAASVVSSVDAYFPFRHGVSHAALFAHHDRINERARRTELLGLLHHLHNHDMLFTGKRMQSSPFATVPVGYWGFVMLNKMLFQPIINAFPDADAKEISALTQMTAALYNLETVFDLLQLRTLVPPAELVRTAGVKGQHADSEPDLTFAQKGAFIRSLLGQMRWSVEPETTPCPYPNGVHAHLVVLCQRAVHMIIAEMLACRIGEYMVRVEGVWRERGFESTVLPLDIRLPAGNDGCLSYMNKQLHSTNYHAMLRSDPRKTPRRQMLFLSDLQRGRR